MSNVKGSALASRIKWLHLEHGPEGLAQLKPHVSPEIGQLLDLGASMSRWYPFDQFIELCVTMDRVFGAGDLALIKPLGRYGADANLTTIYRLFFKVGRVKWILARAARLWRVHYDSGRLLVREFPGREVELEIDGFATPHRVHCLSVHGWAERSAEISGVNDVRLAEIDCRANGDERCRFRMAWD